MGLEPDARLVPSEDVDLRSLPLTPADFFVYSRINSLREARPTVAEIVSASGQPQDIAMAAISKLVELGVVSVEGATEPKAQQSGRRRTASGRMLSLNNDVRARALTRKRELLEAQMRSMRERAAARKAVASEAAGSPPEGEAPLPVSRPVPVDEGPRGPRSILDEVRPVAANDPRLVKGANVEIDRQRRLLGLRDSLRHVGHFDLLGLDPIDDAKVIRRAYHIVSRDFHPDSFYGKELGSFREVLDELFRRARASYELLLDPARRKPIVDAHEAKLAADRSAREQVERRQQEAEARRLEAENAEKHRNAREARGVRDKERQGRIRNRAIAQRRKQAIKHADQAERELNQGRHGTAATLFRLAFEQDPSNTGYERSWRQCLVTARQTRAEKSFQDGLRAQEDYRPKDAARFFAAAAEADPTLQRLAAATSSMAEVDVQLALKFAKSGLELLADSRAQGIPIEDHIAADVHEACARAYVSAEDKQLASEQARLAFELAPSDPRRTLLKQTKVT